ncbi:telomere-capping, CST complex subunit-domain-containing protein [Cladochytrium replicatum]|nr:telomere-capping, CST complex subunit-domain-containing protein [Cladochytrium replicatum]
MLGSRLPGKPVFLNEITSDPESFVGKSVRVLGRLSHFNPATVSAFLEDPVKTRSRTEPAPSLLLDLRLITPFDARVGSWYTLIGEVERMDGREKDVFLRVRVERCVDGLDVDLYNETLKARRDIEMQLESRRGNGASATES